MQNEEGNVVREYEAMHEEDFWSSRLREDEKSEEEKEKLKLREKEKKEGKRGKEKGERSE